MVRAPERPASHQRIVCRQKSGYAVDFCQFQSLLQCQRRHDPRDPLGNHRFACSRRSDHQKVVKSADRDLYCPSKTFLSFDLTEICFLFVLCEQDLGFFYVVTFRFSQILDHLIEIFYPDHFHIRDQSRLPQIFCRNNAETAFFFPRPDDHWQDS